MRHIWLTTAVVMICYSSSTSAVTPAEDVAATIMLRGHPCGGKEVTNIAESEDAAGNKRITATCPNGKKYRIDVSADGEVVVTAL